MIEREGKILNINKTQVIESILKQGGVKVSEGIISGVYYKKDDVKIRLRVEPKGTILCLKKKVDSKETSVVKIREELEVSVDSQETMILILEAMGFSFHKKIYKMRTSFLFNGTQVEIDEYEGIPVLLEIEGETDQIIQDTAQKLGFSNKDIVDYSFSDIEKMYSTTK